MSTLPQPDLFAPRDDDPLLVKLNPEQRRAVQTTEGPLLVLAGAGSGKTRVITHRIAWLIARKQVAAWQILAMTFTNKAAGEMRERVAHLLGDAAGDIWLGTFHAIGVKMLRQLAGLAGLQPGFSIYDTDDQVRMIGRVMKALNISDDHHKPKSFAAFIDRAKNRCLLPGDQRLLDSVDSTFDSLALAVYKRYESDMRAADAVDFGDLIMRPVQVLAQNPEACQQFARRFRYVLVDEFQDTNHAQFELLKLLTGVHGNLCVVGDDDQSIYSWRGAEVGNILGFPKIFPGAQVIKLERNYRSTANILAASTAVVAHNATRHGKVLWTEAGAGDKLKLHIASSDRDEADWVARQIEQLRDVSRLSEIAVFYRTNALSRVLEESMRRFRLPYALIGGQRFYERAEIKDALSWCRILVNPNDSAGWLRAVVSPKRGIGKVTLDAVNDLAAQRGVAVPEACELMLRSGGTKAHEKLKAFMHLVAKMRDGIATQKAHVVGKMVLEQSGLREALKQEGSLEAEGRLENLDQLLSAMAEYAESAQDPTLRSFLEQVALVSDTDKLGDDGEKVSLMTMHSTKGLEYDYAFVVGLEEGLLPHANAMGGMRGEGVEDEHAIEEERRLFYVAMTRARKRLHLSHANTRRRFGGDPMPSDPSRFLQQVPPDVVEIDSPASAWRQTTGWGQGAQAGRTNGFSGRNGAWSQRLGGSGAPAVLREEPAFDRSSVSPFVPGGRVRHRQFGIGKVLESEGQGSDARLTVQFPGVGIKRIVARYVDPA